MTLQFEKVSERTRRFGDNSYIEVSRKRIREEGGEETHFLLVTRGFFERDGETKRWTKFVTLPLNPELVKGVTEDLLAALKDAPTTDDTRPGGSE